MFQSFLEVLVSLNDALPQLVSAIFQLHSLRNILTSHALVKDFTELLAHLLDLTLNFVENVV